MKMSRKVASSLILALVITMTIPYGVAPAAAQGGAPGGDVLLSTFEHDDYHAVVAYNSNAQEFLVVWSHQGDIYGQRYNYQGVPQGENFVISTTFYGKRRPAAAYSLPTDTYLVVWEDYRNAQDYDIYGQLVDADGTLLDNPSTPEDETDPTVNFGIYTGNGNQQYVDLAFDGSSYLVVWQGNYQNDSVDVLGRFVGDDGTVELAVLPIGETGGLPYGEPAVAYNATANEYLVVFQYGEDADAEIHGRRVNPAGLLPGNEYTIADQSRAGGADVAAAAWGAYVVVWSDYREPGECNIYGQVVLSGADSAFDGYNFAICAASTNQFYPAIARSPSTGQFLVVWKDGRQDTESGWSIYGQRLLADANLAGNNFAVSTAIGDQEDPAIAASQAPDLYFVAWEDSRTGADDVYGQRVAWTGSLLWHEFGISAQPDDQTFPAVAYNPDDDQYLAVWQDGDEIRAQRLSADGQPLEDPWALETDGANWFPDVAYNSQRNEYLVVWSDVGMGGGVEGRRVPPAGEATICLQVPDSADGFHPRITYNEGEDRYLVVWNTLHGDIYGRILYGDGLAIGTLTTVCTEDGYQYSPVVAFEPDQDRFLVVWSDDRADFGTDLYGRFVLPDGQTWGGEFCIAGCADGIDRTSPALAYNPDDQEYLVVYEYQREAEDYDIYGQRLGWDGTLAGTEIGIWDQDDAAWQVLPDLLYVSSANRYYVVWSDRRDVNNGYDLYGRWLESDGSPATGSIPALYYPGDQTYVRLAGDPEHEQGLAVWVDYRSGAQDIYGRLGALDTTPPTARFTRDPTVGQSGDTFTFNAWPSDDNITPRGALAARWDFNSDGNWETSWSYNKVVTKTVLLSGTYTVTLEVRDLMWFTDTLSLPISVQAASANTPPTATLTISPVLGLAGSTFTLDASGCTDAETPTANLQVRWDWENDGAFDTLWSVLKVRTPSYTDAGLHTVRVEVRDEEGLTDAAARNLLVLPSTVITLEVSPAAATMAPGGTVQFRATAWDTYDNEMSNPSVVWSVTDGTSGIIDSRGVFTASTQAGTYANVIQATSNGVNDTATVTIVWPYRVYLPLVLRDF
jgi:hypothetical protein